MLIQTEINISDYLSLELVGLLFEQFSEQFKDVSLALVDINGKNLISVNHQDMCASFHQKNALTEKGCIRTNRIAAKNISENRFAESSCKNGLVDMAIPIIISQMHMGTIYVGQVFIKDDREDEDDFFKNQAVRCGFDQKAYLNAFKKVPVFTRSEFNNLIRKINKEIIQPLKR